MFVYLDLDPVLKLEGCRKHGEGCRAACTGRVYEQLISGYAQCDQDYDKDTGIADWYNCFFQNLLSGAVAGAAFMEMETMPPIVVTSVYCELWVQPGCPLCVALRISSSPCSWEPIRDVCPRMCKSCKCPEPSNETFRAAGFLDCPSGPADWGSTCSVDCPANTSSVGQLECLEGEWRGTLGDPSCMADCNGTGLTLPPRGTSITAAGSSGDCDRIGHGKRCQLACELGTSPSAWWECNNGVLGSTLPDEEPQCLVDCGEPPPIPDTVTKFGPCENPVLEDPEYVVERSDAGLLGMLGGGLGDAIGADILALALAGGTVNLSGVNLSGANLTNFAGANLSDLASILNNATVNGTTLRDTLDSQGLTPLAMSTCQALQDDDAQRPPWLRWNMSRRLSNVQGSRPTRRLQTAANTSGNLTDAANALFDDLMSNDTNGSNNSNVFVPMVTASGSICPIECKYPYSPSGAYRCWNGTWQTASCTVQLKREGLLWPVPGSDVVSPLGGVYVTYNLPIVVTPPKLARGRKVQICAIEKIGCPPAGTCIAEVPVADRGRVTALKEDLRVRLGDEAQAIQKYGCEYEVTLPDGTVQATADRLVFNENVTWSYRLVPPPPKLMMLRLEPLYNAVIVNVMYDVAGTVKCMVTEPGVQPTRFQLESMTRFQVQTMPDVPVRYTEWDLYAISSNYLEELTEYDIFCRATGMEGLSESMVSVYDNVVRFTTKTRIPYARAIEVIGLSEREVTVSLIYSTQCLVRCTAQQQADGAFDASALELAVAAAPEVEFNTDAKEVEIVDLVPGMPTQIICRGVKEEGAALYWQPWDDVWLNNVTLTMPAMTSTALQYLNASGCQLVPPFSPDATVYACALPAGVSSATVSFSAAVPADAYSHLNCNGVWGSECSASLEVTASSPATWRVEVRSQAGHIEPVLVVAMEKPPVVPIEIRPLRFLASAAASNMTICAKAEDDYIPADSSQVTVTLLPGPWELELLELHVGSTLPTCSCQSSGCNLEVLLRVRGAGADLIAVLFVNGFPGFTLDDALRVHFDPPRVADVQPAEASMYVPTLLTIRGSNFGYAPGVGAEIHVEKVGPPLALPAAQWFGDCPRLHVNVTQSVFQEMPAWAPLEFNGQYTMRDGDRDRYEFDRLARVTLNSTAVSLLPQEILEAGPEGPEEPVRLEGALAADIIIQIGMCCYRTVDAERLLSNGTDGRPAVLLVRRHGRRFPELRKMGKVWDFNSREVRDLRITSPDSHLGRGEGWTVKFQDPPPGPMKKAAGFWGRRLAEETPDLAKGFEGLKTMAATMVGGFPLQLAAGSENQPEMLGSAELREGHGRRLCKDDTAAMKRLLEQMDVEIPGVSWLITCKTVTGMQKNLCMALLIVCECSCADYQMRPNEVTVSVQMRCERCGDGVLLGQEQCDDGNLRDGDGCNFRCEVEEGWRCDDGEPCVRVDGQAMPSRNLCGPTTWLDDRTLQCELAPTARSPLELWVTQRDQSSEPAGWVRYAEPSVMSLDLGVETSRRLSEEDGTMDEAPVLEFIGGQELVLNGRGLPPDEVSAQRLPVALLLDDTLLCGDLQVTSSSELTCFATQSLNLDRVSEDPKITIRVDEVSSPGIPLSVLRLPLRRPELSEVVPPSFNDTDSKLLTLAVNYTGLPEHGTLNVTMGGVDCYVWVHTPNFVQCELGYLPVGSWNVEMRLGSVRAVSSASVETVPTLCPVGTRRVAVETSECEPCGPGTAEPEVNDDFECPSCRSAQYQNDTGEAYCRRCTPKAFSVGNRSSKEHCRCLAGYFHAYGDAGLAQRCSQCEASRGFGWGTSNWTIDCANCKFKYSKNPLAITDFGPCPEECYGIACSPCPFGTTCFGNAAWPRILPGFWAEDVYRDNAGKVERCMPMEACIGELGDGVALCAEGYGGVRCGVCLLGYYKEQHTCVICPENQWIWGAFFMLVFIAGVVFGVIPAQVLFMTRLLGLPVRLPLIWRLACAAPICCLSHLSRCARACYTRCRCCCSRRDNATDLEGRRVAWACQRRACYVVKKVQTWDDQVRAAPLLRTLSMCLNYGHTCYAFSMLQRPAVAWPGPSWELLSWTKLLTVDVEFMKPDCVVPLPFFQKWVGKFCFPFGLVALLFCVTLYLSFRLRHHTASADGQNRPKIWNAFVFTLALVIHVSLIWHLKVVLSPVDCNWCREGVTCLDEYTLVECWTDDPTWKKMIIISIVDFIFISGAFPLFLTFAIWMAWKNEDKVTPVSSPAVASTPEMPRRAMTTMTMSVAIIRWTQASQLRSFTSFFVSSYRSKKDGGNFITFSWELVILFRKLTLLLAAKFTTVHPVRGANLQLLILFVTLMGQLTLEPYQAPILNNVDGILNVLEFVTLLSACQLTMGVGDDLGKFYIGLNVIALFSGAALAMLIAIRKLWMTYQSESEKMQKQEKQEEPTHKVMDAPEVLPSEESTASTPSAEHHEVPGQMQTEPLESSLVASHPGDLHTSPVMSDDGSSESVEMCQSVQA